MSAARWKSAGAAVVAAIGAIAAIACKPQRTSAAATPEPPRVAEAKEPAEPASVPGPVAGTRITEPYARMVARDAYFWAWPMVNVHNRRLAMSQVPEPGLMGGLLPAAPLNSLAMLSDYVEPAERDVACPNQDVVYGLGLLALDESPVVIQVGLRG
jgi:hypothetical protein